MSYSYSVSEPTKEAALAAVKTQFATIVQHQPVHAKDEPAVLAAAEAFVGLLRDPAANEAVAVAVYGSLSWTGGTNDNPEIIAGNVSVTANIMVVPEKTQTA